jgi:exodeoxyribonuclease X
MNRKEEFLKNCIVLDTETTSKDYKVAEVIELGYAINVGGEWSSFVDLYKPQKPIEPAVSAITNITNGMVKTKPYFEDRTEDIKSVISAFAGEVVCIAHNAFYDKSVLERYAVTCPTWVCTLRLARKLYGNDPTVEQFNLPYLRYRFEILDPAYHVVNAHRADSDALVTGHLLSIFVDEMIARKVLKDDLPYVDQILNWLDEPVIVDTMPFGKHKGQKLVDIPMSYWKWALENMDSLDENKENFDKDFAASVAIALEKIM